MEAEDGEEVYAVSIKGHGITLERIVSAGVARQIINAIMGGSAASESFQSQQAR